MNAADQVNLVGTISSGFEFNHNVVGEDFYLFYLSVTRKSGITDNIPVIISSKIIDASQDMTGAVVEINGSFRSYNLHLTSKSKTVLYVFADYMQISDKPDTNCIYLEGFICKPPTYRTTPLGREISDAIIAINRKYTKSDYIPVIGWSRNATFLYSMAVGTKIIVKGRIQSREYDKTIDGVTVRNVAYEVSASNIVVCTGGDLSAGEGSSEQGSKEA